MDLTKIPENQIRPPTLKDLKGVMAELGLSQPAPRGHLKEGFMEKASAIYEDRKDELQAAKSSEALMAAVLLKALGREEEAVELFLSVWAKSTPGISGNDPRYFTDIRTADLIISGDGEESKKFFLQTVDMLERKIDMGAEILDLISLEAWLRGEMPIARRAHNLFYDVTYRPTAVGHTLRGIVAYYLGDTKEVEKCISDLEKSRGYYANLIGTSHRYHDSFQAEINTGIFFTVLAGVDLRNLIPKK
jgi:hypothetical protein